jgi:hypothetical protein
MTIRRFCLSLLIAGGAVFAQDKPDMPGDAEAPPDPPKEGDPKPAEGVTFTEQEIQNLLATFDQTYKNKALPEDDAITTLANLKNAYNFLRSKGKDATKEQLKLKDDIIDRVKKGLGARNRQRVNLASAQALGELGDPAGAATLLKWLENELDEKTLRPQAVEYGFLSLAWIGPQDKGSLEFVLDYATKGKHQDSTVAAQAIKACAQWRELDGNTRKEFFDKITMYMQGLYGKWKGGDPKTKATYEQRYKAVETDGLDALRELSTDGTKFDEPQKARDWFNENKRQKWEKYVGPRFRQAPAPPSKEGAKPEG